MDPVTISVIALLLSIISILFSFHNAGVDRRIQCEQLRGNIITRLTVRGIEVSTITKTLLDSQDVKQHIKLMDMLTEITQGIIDLRKSLNTMTIPPFFVGAVTQQLSKTQSDIDDIEYIFDNLKKAVDDSDFEGMQIIVRGIHERLFGKK